MREGNQVTKECVLTYGIQYNPPPRVIEHTAADDVVPRRQRRGRTSAAVSRVSSMSCNLSLRQDRRTHILEYSDINDPTYTLVSQPVRSQSCLPSSSWGGAQVLSPSPRNWFVVSTNFLLTQHDSLRLPPVVPRKIKDKASCCCFESGKS